MDAMVERGPLEDTENLAPLLAPMAFFRILLRLQLLLLQIIDPYVEIEVIGIPADNCKQRTKTIIDNGKYELFYH